LQTARQIIYFDDEFLSGNRQRATPMFAVGKKGHDHILHFELEDWWVGDYESFCLLTPSKYYVEDIEDVDMILIIFENGRN
jgi:hypothetical protein